jgi:hypothetical protein
LFLKRQISRPGWIIFHPLCIYSGISNIGPSRFSWTIVESGVNYNIHPLKIIGNYYILYKFLNLSSYPDW